MTSYASLTTLVRSMSGLRVDGQEIARDWTRACCTPSITPSK